MSGAFGPRGYAPGDALLVCQRRQDDRYVDAVAGSQIVVVDCGHYATMSPSGISLMAGDDSVRSICTRCYLDDPRLEKEPHRPVMAPGAKNELRTALPDPKDQSFLKWVDQNFEEEA